MSLLTDIGTTFVKGLALGAASSTVNDANSIKNKLIAQASKGQVNWNDIEMYVNRIATPEELEVFDQAVKEQLQYSVPWIKQEVVTQCKYYSQHHLGAKHGGTLIFDDTNLMTLLSLNESQSSRTAKILNDNAYKFIVSAFKPGNSTGIVALQYDNNDMIKLYYGKNAISLSDQTSDRLSAAAGSLTLLKAVASTLKNRCKFNENDRILVAMLNI